MDRLVREIRGIVIVYPFLQGTVGIRGWEGRGEVEEVVICRRKLNTSFDIR